MVACNVKDSSNQNQFTFKIFFSEKPELYWQIAFFFPRKHNFKFWLRYSYAFLALTKPRFFPQTCYKLKNGLGLNRMALWLVSAGSGAFRFLCLEYSHSCFPPLFCMCIWALLWDERPSGINSLWRLQKVVVLTHARGHWWDRRFVLSSLPAASHLLFMGFKF